MGFNNYSKIHLDCHGKPLLVPVKVVKVTRKWYKFETVNNFVIHFQKNILNH